MTIVIAWSIRSLLLRVISSRSDLPRNRARYAPPAGTSLKPLKIKSIRLEAVSVRPAGHIEASRCNARPLLRHGSRTSRTMAAVGCVNILRALRPPEGKELAAKACVKPGASASKRRMLMAASSRDSGLRRVGHAGPISGKRHVNAFDLELDLRLASKHQRNYPAGAFRRRKSDVDQGMHRIHIS
jgi:hypothetical protein